MALVRDFELPGTGYVVDDAYHVIIDVKTEKRLQDYSDPVDRPSEDRGPEVYWKAGYIGRIGIQVFASKDSRDNNMKPIGAIGLSPTDVGIDSHVATPGKAHEIMFFIDPESADSILTQAYNHLKTTEYYKDAQEV